MTFYEVRVRGESGAVTTYDQVEAHSASEAKQIAIRRAKYDPTLPDAVFEPLEVNVTSETMPDATFDLEPQLLEAAGPLCFPCLTEGDEQVEEPAVVTVQGTSLCRKHALEVGEAMRQSSPTLHIPG